jgi:hypothetical protein
MATPFQVGWSQGALEPGIKAWTEIGFKSNSLPPIFSRLLNVESSKKAKETLRNYPSFGPMAQVAHGAEFPQEVFMDGYQTIFNHLKYAKLTGIDRETVEDDQYAIVGPRMGKLLARSSQLTKEIIGHTVFNNAFSANLSDGVPLISATHPILKGGGTGSNILGTAADPSYTALSAMYTMMRNIKDGAGQPLSYINNNFIWLVHTDFETAALQVVDSMTAVALEGTLTTNANSGVKNPYRGKVKVIGSPFLTDNDASFLIAQGAHELYFFNRRDDTTPESWMEKNPEVMFSALAGRYSAGAVDWRGIVGTPGA